MIAVENIREVLTSFLSERGICAISAWPAELRGKPDASVTVVSVRQCRSDSSGFLNYLGRRYNEDRGAWEELYGRKLLLTFGLDCYVPADQGGGECERLFEQLTVILQEEPAGLKIIGFSRGETAFREDVGMLTCAAELECTAFLYAVADEDGAFLDFEVKGVTQ